MDEGPRVGRLRVVTFAGLLILCGGGCLPASRSSQTVQLAPTVAVVQTSSTDPVKMEAKECWDLDSPGSTINIQDVVTQRAGKDIDDAFQKFLERKYQEGWKMRLLCIETAQKNIYFALWNLDGTIQPDLYAAPPDERSSRGGTASLLGRATWGGDLAATTTESLLSLDYSRSVGIRGNGDADTFRELSWKDGIVTGYVRTGTLDADVEFIPRGQTRIKNICTMDPFDDPQLETTHCYPNP